MPETDIVVSDLKLTKDGVFDFDDLYKTIKEWISFHNYAYFERNYIDVTKVESKDIRVKFETEKRVDDYIKFIIEFTIKVADHKIVIASNKKKKLVQGTLTIAIGAAMQSDYGSEWEDQPLKKFFRGIYDKFVEGDKRARLHNELKEETYSLYNDIKAFLNLQRF